MAFTEVTTNATGRLLSLAGESIAILDEESRYRYGMKTSGDHALLPAIVLKSGALKRASARLQSMWHTDNGPRRNERVYALGRFF